MKPKRMLRAVVLLIGLLVVVFLVAHWWVSGYDATELVDAARSKCVEDGFPAQNMIPTHIKGTTGIFGFGGRGTVEFFRAGKFGPDGKMIEVDPDGKRIPKNLRVELRRFMNLMDWEVVSVVEIKDQ